MKYARTMTYARLIQTFSLFKSIPASLCSTVSIGLCRTVMGVTRPVGGAIMEGRFLIALPDLLTAEPNIIQLFLSGRSGGAWRGYSPIRNLVSPGKAPPPPRINIEK